MDIRIITVGGTIDKVYFDDLSQYEVGESLVNTFFDRARVGFTFVVEPLLRKDSLKLTGEDRRLILNAVQASPENHIVITHGTDTMVDTGKELVNIPNKVIVLTGAMQPARFQDSDAMFNLGTAVAAAQMSSPGVYIAMNGLVLPVAEARKNRDLGRFEKAL